MDASLDDAPCLYYAALDDGYLLEVNKTLCRELGYTKDELTGQKLERICTLATRIFQQTHLFPLLKMQGSATEIFISLQTKDGNHLPLLINAERKEQGGRSWTVYTGIVVHNRKKFEDELVAAKKAAEKALHENTALQKAKQALQANMELLDRQVTVANKQHEELRQFSRVITHDLQEPLRKLMVFTNMLLEGDETVTASKALGKIKSVTGQMRSIVSGLQQFVWLTETPAKKTFLTLRPMFDDVLAHVKKENPDIGIRFTAEEMPQLEGDAEQLRFLFHEIFSNAVRFRKPDQEAVIHVSALETRHNRFKGLEGSYSFAPYLRIQVADNGTGFDTTYKDQVFELFRRLHAASGRGVGLSLCKKIMQNHDGVISIDSQPGLGTTVSLFFPLSNPASLYQTENTQQKSTPANDEQTKDYPLRG